MFISEIAVGHWRLKDWGFDTNGLINHTNQLVDLGISTFDHADIYGNYECEYLFGKALEREKRLRKKIQLVTKMGIKLVSNKFPERQIKQYDYSTEYILESVENSLKHFHTDYLDVLLLHRPAPFFNGEEIAQAFSILKKSGKVLHFGVSNFLPMQFEILQNFLGDNILLEVNQLEISPYCLEHFDNHNLPFLMQKNVLPMAWSPMAAGKINQNFDERSRRIKKCLDELLEKYSVTNIDTLVYAWIFKNPSKIVPIVGSQKIERVKSAIEAKKIHLSLEDWYKIYSASKGFQVP